MQREKKERESEINFQMNNKCRACDMKSKLHIYQT